MLVKEHRVEVQAIQDAMNLVKPTKKYITVLQNKPLPFKDLLDVIHSKHDLEQDFRYSPHILGVQLDLEQEPYDDDGVPADDIEEHGQTTHPFENSNLRAYDDDLPRLSRSTDS
ncbi:hypothetical protein AtNW77_Chr5g0114191 [Arabidopsis thaliana]|uniref:Uncharacterized protein n=1 Tax=Arabidopsis thaliana x Arabidopsis arenosa TaxID=1240361 RepID=A0A8T2D404_9BRAS|nr:hypothetical protein ISN45_At05g027390 [Arabidopsis thaliana x Arabidopsis arenosa]